MYWPTATAQQAATLQAVFPQAAVQLSYDGARPKVFDGNRYPQKSHYRSVSHRAISLRPVALAARVWFHAIHCV